jgi:putative membrane protein
MKIMTFALVALLAAPIAASADTKTGSTTTTTTDKSKTTDKTSDTNSNVPTNKTGTDKTATDKKSGKLADADLQVMAQMHHVNQMEIDMGKLAQTKGSTQGVKTYGQMLVKDHQSADKDLLAFAKKNGATIPMFKPTTEADQKDEKDDKDMSAHVKTLKGADFDKDFLSMMVQGHEKVLAKLDTAMGMVGSDELKTLIGNVKPTVQKHADQARDLQKANPQAMK